MILAVNHLPPLNGNNPYFYYIMKKFNLKILLWLFYSLISTQMIKAQFQIPIKQFTLSNGLTVILNEDHSRPKIFGYVVVKAGAKDDPDDARGMAHYQEHMLFKGTEGLGTTDWNSEKIYIDQIFQLYDQLRSTSDTSQRNSIQKKINEVSLQANQFVIPNEFDKEIKAMGGTKLNANTSYDRTVYFNEFPANQFERWLELYAHRFEKPVFRGFQAELEVVYEEKNMYSDMFQTQLLETFDRNFFKVHPYGKSLIGSVDDLKNPPLTKMFQFFKDWYVPNNMALVLSGDFNSEEIIPVIERTFGRLQSKEIPKRDEFKEEPFQGRILVEDKLSPIKLALIGFRTVPHGHPDEVALQICNNLLSNQDQTGLLDKLAIDGKLMAANMINRQYNEYGSSILLVIPKLIGQKLEDAEALAIEEVKKLRQGQFTDQQIEAIKMQFYKNFQTGLENIESKALMFGEAFASGLTLEQTMAYPDKVYNITREDVIRVANTYYGDNYLVLFSHMGSPKKEKIDKPGYKPLVVNTEKKSTYAEYLASLKTNETEPRFIDLQKDIQKETLREGLDIFYVKNELNDVFNIDLRFDVGAFEMPLLGYAAEVMNYAGTSTMDVTAFKNALSMLGASYQVSASESYLTVSIEGIDSKMEQTLALINQMLVNPVVEQNKIEVMLEGEKQKRKMERSEPDEVSNALYNYILKGNNSQYVKRLTLKEIKKLKAANLVDEFKKALQYSVQVHYTSKVEMPEFKKMFSNNIVLAASLKKGNSPVYIEPVTYNENVIYFVHRKDATQSKINFLINGTATNPELAVGIEAFNTYFGGDFSGLVLQEIREFRSLAYSAGAGYVPGNKVGRTGYLRGALGTQADKTIEAIQVFNDLIRNMPHKTERIDFIRDYMQQSALTRKPTFRNLSTMAESWKLMGYNDDPTKVKWEKYKNLNFSDIVSFHETYIKNKPMVITIVGNKDNVDMKGLAKFGKVIELKENTLFRD